MAGVLRGASLHAGLAHTERGLVPLTAQGFLV
jgi:hypothetical protein